MILGGITAVDRKFDRRQLVPPGFSVLSLDISESGVKLGMAPVACFGICPCCGSRAVRIQSRYQRHVTDLPLSGRNVEPVRHCQALLV